MKNLQFFLELASERAQALKDRQDKFKETQAKSTGESGSGTLDSPETRDKTVSARERYKRGMVEVYDPEMGTVRGPRAKRSTADRRKPDAKPRVKAVGGGKTAPVDYKPQGEKPNRSGSNKTSNTTQQPTKERGSAEVKQSYADKVKAERRAAAKARAAAKKSGGEVKTTKTSAKDTTKAADKLLSTKKAKTVSPPPRLYCFPGLHIALC